MSTSLRTLGFATCAILLTASAYVSITDIELGPPDSRGKVDYSATFTILKPAHMTRSSGAMVPQVPNRGRANVEGADYVADSRASGHVIVASGWQADIASGAGIETMVTPIAKSR